MNSPRLTGKRILTAVALVVPLGLAGVALHEQTVQAQPSDAAATSSLPDGIYLYSDTPQPEQIQHTYVLFEKNQGKVIGAFYAPRSEFACFEGEHRGDQLEVKTVYPEDPQASETTAQLDELHRLDTYSANDQRILSVCKQDVENSGS